MLTSVLPQSYYSTVLFRKVLTESVDSCAEIKSTPSVAQPVLAEFGGRCRKVMLGATERQEKRTSVRFPFGRPLSSKVVVCGHCLVILSLTVNETFICLSSLPLPLFSSWDFHANSLRMLFRDVPLDYVFHFLKEIDVLKPLITRLQSSTCSHCSYRNLEETTRCQTGLMNEASLVLSTESENKSNYNKNGSFSVDL